MTQFLATEDTQRLASWRTKWDQLLKESVIVDVDIRKWHPFARLDAKRMLDLGVLLEEEAAQEAFASVMRSGTIDLIPREVQQKLCVIEQRARTLLKKKTVEVLWGRLLHADNYQEWKAEHEDLVGQYLRMADYIAFNLREGDNLIEQMREQFVLVFDEAYTKISAARGLPVDREAFVREAVQSLIDEVPSEEDVRAKYSFETSFYDAPLSDEIAEAEERAAEIRRETMLKDETISAEKRVIMEEMRRNIEAQTEERRKKVEAAFAKVEDDFYKGIADAFSNVDNYMAENGKMSGRVSKQLRGAIQVIRSMNKFGDGRLTEWAENLEATLNSRTEATNDRTREEAMERLQEALSGARDYVNDRISALPKVRGARIIDDEVDTLEVDTETRSVRRTEDTQVEFDLENAPQTRRLAG